MLLNVGCGEHYAQGWVNLDLHKHGPRPDVVGSALALPFGDSTAERVYCGHVLEHLSLRDVDVALHEIARVLRADGDLMIVGPDVNLTRVHEPVLLDGVTNGGRRWPGDEHRWVATGERTLEAVLAANFEAHLLPIQDVPDGWPVVAREPWQFAISAFCHLTL